MLQENLVNISDSQRHDKVANLPNLVIRASPLFQSGRENTQNEVGSLPGRNKEGEDQRALSVRKAQEECAEHDVLLDFFPLFSACHTSYEVAQHTHQS